MAKTTAASHFLSSSLHEIHSLTLTDGASSTGLCQAVALPHRAAQADVHEALCGRWEWRSARKQHPRVTSQECTHPFEHQTEGGGESKNTQDGDDEWGVEETPITTTAPTKTERATQTITKLAINLHGGLLMNALCKHNIRSILCNDSHMLENNSLLWSLSVNKTLH